MIKAFYVVAMTIIVSSTTLLSQVRQGTAIAFEYSVGAGQWTAYENVLSEYFRAFPYMTDTGNLGTSKKGFSFGITSTSEKGAYLGFHIGSLRCTAWADGNSPNNEQWAEVIMVKTNCTDLSAGYFFIHAKGFRMGIESALSYNVVKMKSERDANLVPKSKDEKFFYVNPGNAQNRKNTIFFGAKFGLPIAFGNRNAFCIEPFYCLPFWKVNTSEIRSQIMPNSTPAHEKSYYRSGLNYGGVRFSIYIGMIS